MNRPSGLMTPVRSDFFPAEAGPGEGTIRAARRENLAGVLFLRGTPVAGSRMRRGCRMGGGSRKPRRWSAAADRAREELLRPCPYLGYDHDRIGVHCLAREALGIAERSFRRAIWLNPFEPRFVLHLAHALLRQKRYAEALATLDNLRDGWPSFGKGEALRETILARMGRNRE